MDNLKDRQPEAFTSLKKAWEKWDAGMLPLDAQSYTHCFGLGELADHFNPET